MYEDCDRPFSAKGMCKSHYMKAWWRTRHGDRPRSTVCVLDVFDTFDVDNGWMTNQEIHAALEAVHPGYTLSATRRQVQRMINAGVLVRRRAPAHQFWPDTQTIQVRPA